MNEAPGTQSFRCRTWAQKATLKVMSALAGIKKFQEALTEQKIKKRKRKIT